MYFFLAVETQYFKSIQTLTVRFGYLWFDKLGVIKNELAMIDEQWSEWSFTQFWEALEKWTLNE